MKRTSIGKYRIALSGRAHKLSLLLVCSSSSEALIQVVKFAQPCAQAEHNLIGAVVTIRVKPNFATGEQLDLRARDAALILIPFVEG